MMAEDVLHALDEAALFIGRNDERNGSMLLHLLDIVFGLFEVLHLEGIHDDRASMQLRNHVFQVGRVVGCGIGAIADTGIAAAAELHHEQLAEFFIKRHMRDILACQLLVLNVCLQLAQFVDLLSIQWRIDERPVYHQRTGLAMYRHMAGCLVRQVTTDDDKQRQQWQQEQERAALPVALESRHGFRKGMFDCFLGWAFLYDTHRLCCSSYSCGGMAGIRWYSIFR